MPQAVTQQKDVQLPPGFEDAQMVQSAAAPAPAGVALPKGYEDAKPAQPPAPAARSTAEPVQSDPTSVQRFSEVTTGFQHPIDELGRELRGIAQHPLEFGKDIAQTAGIPREFWSHPIQQFKNIGGSGIPGAVFGEHGLIKDPLGFGERVTGANELSEDVQSGNLKAIPGDVAGGVVNLAALRSPARAVGEQVAGAREALTPMRPRRVPMGAYDENTQGWIPGKATPEPAETGRLEPFRLTSPPGGTEPAVQGRLPFGGVETPTPGQKAPVAAPQGQAPATGPQQVMLEPENPAGGRLEPIGKRVGAIVDQATGSKPLEKTVPLNEQLTPAAKRGTLDTANQKLANVFDQGTAPKTAEVDPIKTKYPDPATRQLVRANGEGIVDAANGNPETLKAIHDLTRVELRQALLNAGEDVGQATVSDSKFAGSGGIPRKEAFDRLLQKGYGPDDIVRLAKHTGEPIYRVHDVGADPNDIDVSKHAHATTDLEDARSRIMPFRNQGTPQTISTARGTPGVDYDLHPRENQPAWVKMRHRNLNWEPIK